ncbi:centrosomal protein of 72 kDa [Tachyglossus aculeatus]|uniref:centrosomal protein of 72 kDa n=1 Tax=Tachyglossus aculeatus TaxID=9261 RepID=UPI0018F5A0E9|nr:centrosomal protein of 72 kDa [Tachyglossus aculeatus]
MEAAVGVVRAEEVVLTEEAIRERCRLPHRPLADVRSLSIPGTYREKITHLGNSLKNFTRLKSLDLSRNSLVSLEGIQHLTALENLNLYYNNISCLVEVFRLQTLTRLKDVDFRLNPVVKNESDYRLFVVHMLPSLRQLDDRPVRDSERKASLLHFTSDQAYEFKCPSPAAVGTNVESRSGHPRTKYISSMSKKCTLMDEDDEAVLNLIAKCEWDLSKPPGITGSSKGDCEAEFYSLQGSRGALSPNLGQHLASDAFKQGREKKKMTVPVGLSDEKLTGYHRKDPNLKFEDEIEAYHRCLPQVYFTPHPESQGTDEPFISSQKTVTPAQKILNTLVLSGLQSRRGQPVPKGHYQETLDRSNELSNADDSVAQQEVLGRDGNRNSSNAHGAESGEQRLKNINTVARAASPSCHSGVQPVSKDANEATPLEGLLDLVDRYWNGCKSLHCNEKFLGQARRILSAAQASVNNQETQAIIEEINNLILEKKALKHHLSEQDKLYNTKIDGLVLELTNAHKEMDALKHHLDQSLEENKNLKRLLLNAEQDTKNADTSATLNLQITELQNHNKQLARELSSLKEHLQHYDKIQELTQLLQESHSSLVSTNEHLLRELTETQRQHRTEVEQLCWSHNQFKKTVLLDPPRPSLT